MIGTPLKRRPLSALTLTAALALTAAAHAGPPAPTGRADKVRAAEAALAKDTKRLRVRENLEKLLAEWRALESSGDAAERAASVDGQARVWALLAHWSGTARDRAEAERAASRAADAKIAARELAERGRGREKADKAEVAGARPKVERADAPDVPRAAVVRERSAVAQLARLEIESSELGIELILPADAALRERHEVLSARRGQGPRVYFDVSPMVAAAAALVTLPVEHPAVLRVRVGQYDARTVRFVFDLPAGRPAPEVMAFVGGPAPRLRLGKRGVGEGAPAAVPSGDPLAALLEIQRAIDGVAPGEAAEITPEARRALEAMVADLRPTEPAIDAPAADGADDDEIRLADADAASGEVTPRAAAPGVEVPAVADNKTTRAALAPAARGSLVRIRRVVVDAGHGGRDSGATGKRGTKEKDVNLAIARELAKVLEQKLGVEVVLTRNKDTYVSLGKRVEIANRSEADLFISVHSNAHRNRKYQGIETYYLNTTSNRYANRLAARENQEQWDDAHLDAGDPGEAASEDDAASLPGGALGRDLRLLLADLAMRSATDDSRRLAGLVQSSLVGQARRVAPSTADLGVKHALFFVLLGARMPSVLVESGFLSHADEERRLADPGYQRQLAEAIAAGVARFVEDRNQVASRL